MPINHCVYLGLGSNTHPKHHLPQGLNLLQQLVGPVECSPVFESEAIGINTANFYNLVVRVMTPLSLVELVAELKAIERRAGREAAQKQRIPLDIDILLFDQQITQQPVVIPHADIITRAFVLWPLALLAGEVMHPLLQQSMAQLWAENQLKQQLWPIQLHWQGQALTPEPLLQQGRAAVTANS